MGHSCAFIQKSTIASATRTGGLKWAHAVVRRNAACSGHERQLRPYLPFANRTIHKRLDVKQALAAVAIAMKIWVQNEGILVLPDFRGHLN